MAKGKLQEFLRKSRAEQDYGNLHGNKMIELDLQFYDQIIIKSRRARQ